MEKPLIYDLDYPEIIDLSKTWNLPSYRSEQIWKGIYQQFWLQPEDFSNLPKQLRKRLVETFSFNHLEPVTLQNSTDGETQKVLFRLPGGQPVETVLMRYEKRRTLCISTQSGCGMGCVFCATGQMGYLRNLSSGEIIEQILYFARYLAALGEQVTNVVFMGMGEPFHNYDNVMAAIDRLNHDEGMNFGARRFTLSTVGLLPAIERFAKEKRQVNLAVSLHAADDSLRSSMMPINKKYPIKRLIPVLQEYTATTGRRISFEWALIKDVNDTPEQAYKLANLVAGMLAHVNLIPLNPTQGYAGEAADSQRVNHFKSILESNGIPCTIRVRRGIDIQAGCGQLASGLVSP